MTDERDTRGPIRIGDEMEDPDLNAEVQVGAQTRGASISPDDERQAWREQNARYRQAEADRYERQHHERRAREDEERSNGRSFDRRPGSRQGSAEIELSSVRSPDPRPDPSRSVGALYGLLAQGGWGVLLPAVVRYRRLMGLKAGDVLVLLQLLYHHREADDWVSLAQGTLADELGTDRGQLSRQLTALTKRGLIAVRLSRHGNGLKTRHYCLEPYLVELALITAQDERTSPEGAKALEAEARTRFRRFLRQVQDGVWQWGVDGKTFAESSAELLHQFGLESWVDGPEPST